MTNRELYNKINLKDNGIRCLHVGSEYNGHTEFKICFMLESNKNKDYTVIGHGVSDATAANAAIKSMHKRIRNII